MTLSFIKYVTLLFLEQSHFCLACDLSQRWDLCVTFLAAVVASKLSFCIYSSVFNCVSQKVLVLDQPNLDHRCFRSIAFQCMFLMLNLADISWSGDFEICLINLKKFDFVIELCFEINLQINCPELNRRDIFSEEFLLGIVFCIYVC